MHPSIVEDLKAMQIRDLLGCRNYVLKTDNYRLICLKLAFHRFFSPFSEKLSAKVVHEPHIVTQTI